MIAITDIKIHLVKSPGKPLRAFATVIFNDAFVVHDFKIIEGPKGLFVGMPAKKTAGGDYQEIAYPITGEFNQLLQAQILRVYLDFLSSPNLTPL